MSVFDIATLTFQQTKAAIYAAGLVVAESVGLVTTSWEAGDPTRSDYYYLAEILGNVEDVVVQWIRAGYGDFVGDDWAGLWAKETFNVTRIEATEAETVVVLTNTGGGYYEIATGALTFKNSTTGKTFHNTDAGVLDVGPGTTLSLAVIADEAGSASSSAAGEIDDFVTTLDDSVTVTNPTAAIGLDREVVAVLVPRARLKLGALSPNGPADAYNFVATTPELTGTTGVTRTRTLDDSDTGDVTLYLAGPAGAVSGADRDAVEAAIVAYALPLTITPTVASAVNHVLAVTYTVWVYTAIGMTSDEVADLIESALEAVIVERPIGGDVISGAGKIYKTLLEAAIRTAVAPHCFAVSVSVPTSDTTLASNEVAALGVVTPTVTFVANP